jgi:hypothetical protein
MTTRHEVRPAEICRALLAALDAADGRRKQRKRDQTADAIGLSIKRDLLQQVIEDDPAPEEFEAWLLAYPATCATRELSGASVAMARLVFEEWRLAHDLTTFRRWLAEGAPSDDAHGHQR